jgi:hypothetical protein
MGLQVHGFPWPLSVYTLASIGALHGSGVCTPVKCLEGSQVSPMVTASSLVQAAPYQRAMTCNKDPFTGLPLVVVDRVPTKVSAQSVVL